MSIAEKLTQVAENELKVYDAGYAKGLAEVGSVSMRGTYVIDEYPSIMFELDFEYPVSGTYYYYNGTAFVKGELKKISLYYDEDYGDGFISFEGSGSVTEYRTNNGWRSNGIHSSDNVLLRTITITDDLTGALLRTWLKANATFTSAHFEEGKQAERAAFWDSYQDGGNRTKYNYAFANFDESIFFPKYDIRPTQFQYGFGNPNALPIFVGFDLGERLRECGVVLDTENCIDFSGAFLGTNMVGIPTLDLRSATLSSNLFRNALYISRIEKLIVNANTVFAGSFQSNNALKEIRFEGAIGKDIDLHWSTNLSRESIHSLYWAGQEPGASSTPTFTLSLAAVNKAYETSKGANDGSTSEEWETMMHYAFPGYSLV